MIRDRENAATRTKRAGRRAALHRIVGLDCVKCGAPATCLVSPVPATTGLRDGSSGPADIGLHVQASRVLESATGRVSMCRHCQVGHRNSVVWARRMAALAAAQPSLPEAPRPEEVPPEVRTTLSAWDPCPADLRRDLNEAKADLRRSA